ncbi:MAG: prepilin-type N-terminal cleavage/methylation domain-containing protein [Polyangiales bacterium]
MRSQSAKRRGPGRSSGFTLMELMTVVTIVGILSAVAIPTFSNYIYKARTSEATDFLGVIRLREESYRSEFGVYCTTLASGGNDPASLTNENMVPNPSTTRANTRPFVSTDQWRQLGARPTGPVRFGYGVAAGSPADLSNVQSMGWTSANIDFWFVARAVGDLDNDSTYVTFEIYSPTKNVFIGDKDRNAIGKGWE